MTTHPPGKTKPEIYVILTKVQIRGEMNVMDKCKVFIALKSTRNTMKIVKFKVSFKLFKNGNVT